MCEVVVGGSLVVGGCRHPQARPSRPPQGGSACLKAETDSITRNHRFARGARLAMAGGAWAATGSSVASASKHKQTKMIRGPRGPRGFPGPQGIQGIGEFRVRRAHQPGASVVNVTVNDTGESSHTYSLAQCPAGMVAVGGGAIPSGSGGGARSYRSPPRRTETRLQAGWRSRSMLAAAPAPSVPQPPRSARPSSHWTRRAHDPAPVPRSQRCRRPPARSPKPRKPT